MTSTANREDLPHRPYDNNLTDSTLPLASNYNNANPTEQLLRNRVIPPFGPLHAHTASSKMTLASFS